MAVTSAWDGYVIIHMFKIVSKYRSETFIDPIRLFPNRNFEKGAAHPTPHATEEKKLQMHEEGPKRT